MELIPLNQHNTQLAQLGQVANQYAARDGFTDYQSRKSHNTLKRQREDLARFVSYLEDAGISVDVDELYTRPEMWNGVTHGLVEGFIRWMLSKGYAIESVNSCLSTIKVYAKLASSAGIIPSDELALITLVHGYTHKDGLHVDQTREVTRVGDKKAQAVSISPEQAKQLKKQPDTPQGRRDALLMCLLLDHGLRCGEIAALTPDAINLSEGTLRFYRAKVDVKQTHDLSRDALQAAIRYFEVACPEDRLLMGSRKSGRLEGTMNERSITRRVEALGEAVGLEGLSAHDARHRWATSAIKSGTDIKALQQAGGWKSAAMPLRYAEDGQIANQGVKLDY
jgi:integrase